MRKYKESKELKPTGESSLVTQNALSKSEQQSITNQLNQLPLDQTKTYFGFGKRKRARAYVRLQPGEGKIIVNGLPIHRYFSASYLRQKVTYPVRVAGLSSSLDIKILTFGGGVQGQLDACIPAVARAILQMDEKYKKLFAERNFLLIYRSHACP
jgi:small subunit ribosomal protein S9